MAFKSKERKKEYQKEYNQRPEVKVRMKEYYQRNKEKIVEWKKKYYQRNKEKILKQSKEYGQRPEVKARRRELIQRPEVKAKVKSRMKEYHKEYYQKPEVKAKVKSRMKEYLKEYLKNRYSQDKNFNIQIRLRSLLGRALKRYTKTGKITSASKYGINYKAIIKHLKPFPEDISKCHVDHIKPLCSFNLEDPEEIKKAFAPENHQWLTAQENMVKGGRY